MEDIKLLAESKFVELEKCICAKMSYRQEFLKVVGNKSVNVYINLHNYNRILSYLKKKN